MTDATVQPNSPARPQHLGCYFGTGVKLVFSQGQARLRLPIARLGTFVHPKYGTVDFTQRDFDEMIENFKNDEAGFTPWLRYGHSILPQHIEATLVDHQPKIGNLLQLSQEGSVLYGYFEPLGQKVVEQVNNREYEGASCEVIRGAVGKDGRPIGTLLVAHALTNSPFVPNMPALQVLSENAGSTTSCEVLDMTQREGDSPMSNANINEVLSQLASGAIEMNSVGKDVIDALRKRLNSAEADPSMKTDLPAGETGPVADKFSANNTPESMKTDNKAGEQGPVAEQFSAAHGAPFEKAASALKEAAKQEANEKNSAGVLQAVTELLSAASGFFQKKGAAEEADKKPAQKFSAQAGEDVKDNSAPGEAQKFSAGAVTSETSSEEGATEMDMKQIQEMVNTAVAGVEQKFSAGIADRDAQITKLTEELNQAKTALTEKAESALAEAQKFSLSQQNAGFDREWNQLVVEGIPAAVVNPVKEVARLVRGNVQKFSNGTEMSLDQALLTALRQTPGNLRVSYDQVGQQFSVGAGNPGHQANAASVFGDIVPGLKQ